MSNGKIDYTVSLRDGFTAVLGKVRAGLGSLAGSVANVGRGAFRALTSLPTLLAGGGGLATIGKSIKEAFAVETMQTQFKVLLGSVDAAKARLKELQDFSASTPFQLDGIAQASRSLHVFSGGVLGGSDSLRIAGDAAAATGRQIEEVGFWYGRAYAAIKNGQPFGEVAMRLQEMGILTGEGRAQIDNLRKAGASTETVFGALNAEFAKFGGGMEELSKTGGGLVSTLKDNVKLSMAEFGEAFTGAAKGGLQTLIAKIGELRESGAVAAWGQRAAQVISGVGNVFNWLRNIIRQAMATEIVQNFVGNVATGFKAVIGIIKGLADGTVGIGKLLGDLGSMIGSSLKLAFMTSLNWLARGLQASIAALTQGLGGSIQALTNPGLWVGLAQVIIGSLGALGAFLIRIFNEPLVLMQAAIDTMIKGMFNKLAGAGGDRDEFGTGRLGRRLGLAVQDNNYEKNLAEAREGSWLTQTAAEGAQASKDILDAGIKKVAEALAPTGAAMADSFVAGMKDSTEVFDTTDARADRDAAASAMARYGDGVSLPDLPKAAALPTASEMAAVTAPAIAAAVKNVDLKGAANTRSDIDFAARSEWMRNVRSGRSPDEQIADNTRAMREALEEIRKQKAGIL
jgi:hypothetical protein